MIRLGLLGGSGKMGGLVRSRLAAPEFSSIRLVYSPSRDEPSMSNETVDVVIDYSSPEFSLAQLAEWTRAGKKSRWLVGSTGWTAEQSNELKKFADHQVLLKTANFSLGILFLRKALRAAESDFFRAGFEVSLKDIHHTRKKDAPSGTALLLKDELRSFANAPIESLREGDVVGFHEVTFESQQERIFFGHDAKDRALFADGALKSARAIAAWPLEKSGRIYTLDDLFSGALGPT